MLNKNNKFLFFLLILFAFSMVSCVDIVEQIKINKNGSGNFKAYLDVGFLGNIALGLAADKIDNSQINQIKSLTTFAEQKLKNINGISNVTTNNNVKNGKLLISFDFDNSKSLNKVFYVLADATKEFYYPNLFKIRNHKFIKLNFAPVLRFFVNKYKKELKEEQYLSLINYKSIYIAPSEIKKFSNPLYLISEDKMQVTFSCSLNELLNTNVDTGLKIKF